MKNRRAADVQKGVKTNNLQLKDAGKHAFAGGHRNPRVKTAKKVWRRYSDIFVLRAFFWELYHQAALFLALLNPRIDLSEGLFEQ